MISIIEKELKYMICQNDFNKLYKYLLDNEYLKEKIVQNNYYLDSSQSFLRKHGISARIREIENRNFEFTVKLKLKTENNLSVKKEVTYPLSEVEFKKIKENGLDEKKIHYLAPILKDTKTILDEDIKIVGCLRTERSFFKINTFITPLCLDKNNYLNYEDYEVEWETKKIGQAKEILEDLFSKMGVMPCNTYGSKNERFQKKLFEEVKANESIRFSNNRKDC